MKKLVLVIAAVVFMAAAALAEFNLRTSIDVSGDYEASTGGNSVSSDVNTSFTLSGEYMRCVAGQYLKLGGGFEVLMPRTYERDTYHGYKFDDVFWYMPLYFSAQTNPLKPVPELFFRLNLGYNLIYFDTNWDIGSVRSIRYNGGFYYALAAGWEFPFGLFADVTYAVYNSSVKYSYWYSSSWYRETIDITYTRIGIGVGYKFGRPRK